MQVQGLQHGATTVRGVVSRRGWLEWGLAGLASRLGYVPAGGVPVPPQPSEADIQDLYRDLDFPLPDEGDDRDPLRAVSAVLAAQVGARLCFACVFCSLNAS